MRLNLILPKKALIKKITLKVVLLLVAPLFLSCGVNYNVKGKVIDAKTGRPVEGAVVAVNWSRPKLIGVPGYNALSIHYGTFEDITDADGNFKIPKYLIGKHFMGVYKEGYICWSSETIFNPDGKDRKEMFKRRYGHRVKNKMVVKLESIAEDFPAAKHAIFAIDVGTLLSSPTPKFTQAIKNEYRTYQIFVQERDKNRKSMFRKK